MMEDRSTICKLTPHKPESLSHDVMVATGLAIIKFS